MEITGIEAIGLAERTGARLRAHADPLGGEDRAVTLTEARALCREDPALVYVDGGDIVLVRADRLALAVVSLRAAGLPEAADALPAMVDVALKMVRDRLVGLLMMAAREHRASIMTALDALGAYWAVR